MRVLPRDIPGVLVIEPTVHADGRGHVFESYSRRALAERAAIDTEFVQENQSRSARGVLRGLHYQIRHPQGKLVRVLQGTIFDVAVDLRRSSPHFGRWSATTLSADRRQALWVPPGFAHGFLVLSESADVVYKVTEYWAPEDERSIRWDDPDLAIAWPVSAAPVVSPKDLAAAAFREADTYP